MADKINATLQAELVRIAKGCKWELPGAWKPEHNAAAIVRSILASVPEAAKHLADTPEARTKRLALSEMILPVLKAGAAINLRRGLLVELKLAPKMSEKEASGESTLESIL